MEGGSVGEYIFKVGEINFVPILNFEHSCEYESIFVVVIARIWKVIMGS